MPVSRRTVLKSIGATLFAPCITLRPEIDRERLVAAFCDAEQLGRYDLDKPFGVGSLTYATDARSMVRAELVNRCEEGQRRLPKVEPVWRDHWRPQGEFRPFNLPAIDSGELLTPSNGVLGTCPVCDDRRISFGETLPPEDYDYGLIPDWDPDDNTYRDPSCPLCHGRDFTGPCDLRVGHVRMRYSRLKPIAALPNVRVAMSEHDEFTILFKADGFEGIAKGVWYQ